MTEGGAAGDMSAGQSRSGDPGRVAAFTDGVFAIVITILVLEISIPENLPEQSLRDAIDEVGPTLSAWIISFLLTGMYWVWHRDLLNQIKHVNRDFVWLNLLFLLPVCLIPFASSVLGEYHDEAIALHLYGVVIIAVNIMRIVLFSYAIHRPALLWETPTRRAQRIGLGLAAAPLVVYSAAMAVADISPTLSLLLFLGVPLLYFLLITALRMRPQTQQAAEDYS